MTVTFADLPPLADLRDLLKRPGISDSDLAQSSLAAASAVFRGAVLHDVSLVTDDPETVYGDSTRVLLLHHAPVVVVSSVVIDGGSPLVELTDYRVRKNTGTLVRYPGPSSTCWPTLWPQDSEIVVTYTHGYAETPAEIQAAVVEAAETLYNAKPAGLTSQTTGGETFSFAKVIGATEQWERAVARYQLNTRDRS